MELGFAQQLCNIAMVGKYLKHQIPLTYSHQFIKFLYQSVWSVMMEAMQMQEPPTPVPLHALPSAKEAM